MAFGIPFRAIFAQLLVTSFVGERALGEADKTFSAAVLALALIRRPPFELQATLPFRLSFHVVVVSTGAFPAVASRRKKKKREFVFTKKEKTYVV